MAICRYSLRILIMPQQHHWEPAYSKEAIRLLFMLGKLVVDPVMYKKATFACCDRSFYDGSRSCGTAKNHRSLAQLKHALRF